jgi:hypothetical protein
MARLRAVRAGQRSGQHRSAVREQPRPGTSRMRRYRAKAVAAICGIVATGGLVFLVAQSLDPADHAVLPGLPTATPTPQSRTGYYIGVFQHEAPQSYAGITAFTKATGVSPRIVSYYSAWLEPFQTTFAAEAAGHGAIPLVQMDPSHISIAAVASGSFDGYLRSYADSVRSYHHKVILGFGHEMNGYWYSWGYTHTPAKVFVAAWRHIVDVFRQQHVGNAIWMWTINVIHPGYGGIGNPARWWPGSSYVNWVGIDGYYYKPSWTFAPLFGPTIKIVRSLSQMPMPIFISETGAPVAYQPEKITDLFAGIRAYGLLGFLWFDANHVDDWALSTPAAIAAFRKGAASVNDP